MLLEKDNYRFQKQEFTPFNRMFDLAQRSSYEVLLDSVATIESLSPSLLIYVLVL